MSAGQSGPLGGPERQDQEAVEVAARAEDSSAGGGQPRSHALVASVVVALVAGMGAMSYAAVPLYQLFCQVTGYGGTTKKAEAAPDVVLDREIKVYFDATTSPGLPWKFKPVQDHVVLKIGETGLAHYRATNLSDKPVTGTASFNVTPVQAGSFFNKIECFCFTEQTLQPGESIDMPVTFFIDPDMVKDADAGRISEITLSYTFYPVKNPDRGVAQRKAPGRPDSEGQQDKG